MEQSAGTTGGQSDGFSALFNDNGGNAQQQSMETAESVQQENRTPVVTDNISEFTVVIEYVEVVKPEVKKEGDKK